MWQTTSQQIWSFYVLKEDRTNNLLLALTVQLQGILLANCWHDEDDKGASSIHTFSFRELNLIQTKRRGRELTEAEKVVQFRKHQQSSQHVYS